jgi:hypothetical protein
MQFSFPGGAHDSIGFCSPTPPQVLLAHHLRQLKLPTFLREYEKLAAEAAREGSRVRVGGGKNPRARTLAVPHGNQPAQGYVQLCWRQLRETRKD